VVFARLQTVVESLGDNLPLPLLDSGLRRNDEQRTCAALCLGARWGYQGGQAIA
jgi:hypothetical protein